MKTRVLALAVACVAWFPLAPPTAAIAEETPEIIEASAFASGTGNMLFLMAGIVLPALQAGQDRPTRLVHSMDALTTALVATEGLKLMVGEKRPDSSARDSFPSGHTSAAFALATVQAHYNPDESFWWYAGATAIGASRVSLNRHYLHDVLAGAALGYLVGRDSLSSQRRLTFMPEYSSANHVVGLAVTIKF